MLSGGQYYSLNHIKLDPANIISLPVLKVTFHDVKTLGGSGGGDAGSAEKCNRTTTVLLERLESVRYLR